MFSYILVPILIGPLLSRPARSAVPELWRYLGLKTDQFVFNADLYHDITGRHSLKMAFRIISAYVLYFGSPVVIRHELILGLSEILACVLESG